VGTPLFSRWLSLFLADRLSSEAFDFRLILSAFDWALRPKDLLLSATPIVGKSFYLIAVFSLIYAAEGVYRRVAAVVVFDMKLPCKFLMRVP